MNVWRTLVRGITVAVAVLALTGIAHTACPSDEVVEKLVVGYPTTPVTGIPANLSLDDALLYTGQKRRPVGKENGSPGGL